MLLLRDAIAPLASFFGVATARSLIIEQRGVYLEIIPTPIIGRRAPLIVNASNTNIQAKQDLFVVEGISRQYAREKIVGTGISYWVDSVLTIDGISGGFQAEFFSIDEMPLTWNLTLRRILDERRGV